MSSAWKLHVRQTEFAAGFADEVRSTIDSASYFRLFPYIRRLACCSPLSVADPVAVTAHVLKIFEINSSSESCFASPDRSKIDRSLCFPLRSSALRRGIEHLSASRGPRIRPNATIRPLSRNDSRFNESARKTMVSKPLQTGRARPIRPPRPEARKSQDDGRGVQTFPHSDTGAEPRVAKISPWLNRDELRAIFQDHSRRDGGIGDWIDQDKTSGRSAFLIQIEEKRMTCLDINDRDRIHFQIARGFMSERVHVHAMANICHASFHGTGCVLGEIALADDEWLFAHPDDRGGE